MEWHQAAYSKRMIYYWLAQLVNDVKRRCGMPEFKNHVLVCDVERDDGAHCGNKGGAEVKKKVIEMLSKHGLRSNVYVSSVGCTSQHRLCDMEQCSMIVYGPGNEGTWYVTNPDDVERIVEEHLIGGNVVQDLVNNGMKIATE